MEQEYSVGVQNRYAFLDEDDPGDILSAAKLPKESKEVKPTKTKEKVQQPSKTSSEQNSKSLVFYAQCCIAVVLFFLFFFFVVVVRMLAVGFASLCFIFISRPT